MIKAETIMAVRDLLSSKKLVVSFTVVIIFILMGFLAPFVSPHDPNRQALDKANLPPMWSVGGTHVHPLGTDGLGRDILSRLLHGASIALFVSLAATAVTALVGTFLGLVSGYFRGKLDETIMRVVDIWMSFPPIVLAIALISVIGTGLLNVVIAIAVVDWTRFTRVVRSEVLNIREKDFIYAAKAIGFPETYIMIREVLPNILPIVIVLSTLEMGIAITVEVLLSFVGFGVRANTPSWGTMISDGLLYFRTSPYTMVFPLITAITVVLSFNLLGESLRERIDPKLLVNR